LWAAIELKLGLFQGTQPIVNIQQEFQDVQTHHPNARCLFISFVTPGGPAMGTLNTSGIKYLILQNESKLLWREHVRQA